MGWTNGFIVERMNGRVDGWFDRWANEWGISHGWIDVAK
jgi:hypothetical protein